MIKYRARKNTLQLQTDIKNFKSNIMNILENIKKRITCIARKRIKTKHYTVNTNNYEETMCAGIQRCTN